MKYILSLLLLVALFISAASAVAWVEHTTEKNEHQYILPEVSVFRQLSPEFSILVWNCHKGEDYGWSEDFARFNRDSDIILLQEFVDSPMMMEEVTLSNKEANIGYTFKRKERLTGVATLSNVKSESAIPLKTLGSEPIIHSKKMTMITTYSIVTSPEKLMVVNIHGINFVGNDTYYKDMENIYNTVKSHKGPMIFAGDFNTWTEGKFQKMLEIAERLGLKKLQLNDQTRTTRGYELDHVFYRGLKTNIGTVHRNIFSSDHFPITATFSVL